MIGQLNVQPALESGLDQPWDEPRIAGQLQIAGIDPHLGAPPARTSTVGDLTAAVGGMEESAVSHQLRLLRTLGLVEGRCEGRRIIYQPL